MKWCIFVDRRCCGEECIGWTKDNCFIYLLLPDDHSDKHQQAEFDWSRFEPLKIDENNLPENSDHQLSFLDELEKLIVQKNNNFNKI